MLTTRTIDATRAAITNARASGKTIGFVPTMGFLHDGHLSLIDVARANGADFIAVSIFVNPTQFGPNEDFERYPRDEKRDAALLDGKAVDLLFLPSVDVMYPPESHTSIMVGAVAQPLEGERRPGHFNGVATVVLKLFNIVQPDIAIFGRKDAQQCAVIERMVRDLDVPVRLVFGETARESDGLARSSRNSYLSAEERKIAPELYRALRAGEEAIARGNQDVLEIETLMRAMLAKKSGIEIDYVNVVDPETFLPPADFGRDILIVGAAKVGRTRLIDNVRITQNDAKLSS
jgi:pantoate--beta-alanine ligase